MSSNLILQAIFVELCLKFSNIEFLSLQPIYNTSVSSTLTLFTIFNALFTLDYQLKKIIVMNPKSDLERLTKKLLLWIVRWLLV